MSEEVNNKISKASEVYAENTILRAAVNAIPYVGSSLDVIFASKGQEIIRSRLNCLLDNLKQEMDKIKENKVDRKYLESGEWFDIILKCIDLSVKNKRY